MHVFILIFSCCFTFFFFFLSSINAFRIVTLALSYFAIYTLLSSGHNLRLQTEFSRRCLSLVLWFEACEQQGSVNRTARRFAPSRATGTAVYVPLNVTWTSKILVDDGYTPRTTTAEVTGYRDFLSCISNDANCSFVDAPTHVIRNAAIHRPTRKKR